MKPHILVVEDDEFVQRLLGAYLEREGFHVSLAASGKELLAALDAEAIDLVLLDLGLPDEDGLTLTRHIRARSSLPVVVLTARTGRADRLSALELGADDYLVKPCDPQELVLRLRNLLGRAAAGGDGGAGRVVCFDGWKMDLEARSLTAPDGGEVRLTRSEFNLLGAFAGAPNRVLSRGQLLDAVSRDEDSPNERVIDVLVARLRRKIERDPRHPKLILTMVGLGYKFSAPIS